MGWLEEKDWTMSPGEILSGIMMNRGLSNFDVAAQADMPVEMVSRILGAEVELTEELAQKLGRLQGSPQFWVNLERMYRADLRRFASCPESSTS